MMEIALGPSVAGPKAYVLLFTTDCLVWSQHFAKGVMDRQWKVGRLSCCILDISGQHYKGQQLWPSSKWAFLIFLLLFVIDSKHKHTLLVRLAPWSPLRMSIPVTLPLVLLLSPSVTLFPSLPSSPNISNFLRPNLNPHSCDIFSGCSWLCRPFLSLNSYCSQGLDHVDEHLS